MLVVLVSDARGLPDGETFTVARVVERARALLGVSGVVLFPVEVPFPDWLARTLKCLPSLVGVTASFPFGLAVPDSF